MTERHREAEALLLFLRAPIPGRTKTRLARRIGARAACRVYERLLEIVRTRLTEPAWIGLRRIAFVDPPWATEELAGWLGPPWEGRPQSPGTLGDRLGAAFEAIHREGAARIVAVGTDAPDLGPAEVQTAFGWLRTGRAVLGPARDGGYYLLGLPRPCPEAFGGIPWSTDRTARVTRERLQAAGLEVAMLPLLDDLDTEADLVRLGRRWPDLLEAAARSEPGRGEGAAGGAGGSSRVWRGRWEVPDGTGREELARLAGRLRVGLVRGVGRRRRRPEGDGGWSREGGRG